MDSQPIRSVLVVGTGIMGQGISELLSEKGVRTVVLGRGEASLQKARQAIAASRNLAVRRRRLGQAEADEAERRLTFTTLSDAAGTCDLILEAVIEDLAIKRAMLERLRPHLASHALVATNTSALRVADLADAVADPSRLVGLHFMNPPTTVSLVELVRTERTSREALDSARAFCQTLGRQVVEVQDAHGFIVNRLLMLLINEAARLVEQGLASPQDIDKAMRLACGHPMGPLSLADWIGLDTVRAELATLAQAWGERYAPASALVAQVQAGLTGRKAGQGFLRYGRPRSGSGTGGQGDPDAAHL